MHRQTTSCDLNGWAKSVRVAHENPGTFFPHLKFLIHFSLSFLLTFTVLPNISICLFFSVGGALGTDRWSDLFKVRQEARGRAQTRILDIPIAFPKATHLPSTASMLWQQNLACRAGLWARSDPQTPLTHAPHFTHRAGWVWYPCFNP